MITSLTTLSKEAFRGQRACFEQVFKGALGLAFSSGKDFMRDELVQFLYIREQGGHVYADVHGAACEYVVAPIWHVARLALASPGELFVVVPLPLSGNLGRP